MTSYLYIFVSIQLLMLVVNGLDNDGEECSVTDSSSCECWNREGMQKRVLNSVGSDGALVDLGLRGILDNVISDEECGFFLKTFEHGSFVEGGGYSNNDGAYQAPQNVAGLTLEDLVQSESLVTEEQYEKILEIRERSRAMTERALNLCPGMLQVEFTQIVQKSPGGKHSIHADNCFVEFEKDASGLYRASCQPADGHPYSTRVAATILFLNDDGFQGGEFYWANLSTGEPEVLVTPQKGKMVYFTSGPENLHGAKPVLVPSEESNDHPRRLTLAMWYVLKGDRGENLPSLDGETLAPHEDPKNRQIIFEIPVEYVNEKIVRFTLARYLVGQQNKPARGSWLAHQDDEGVLNMIFKDNTAMFSIRFKPNSVAVDRFVNGNFPSLQYQLQESVILHGILDELQHYAFGDADSIKEENRLLRLPEGSNVFEKTRKTLPARSL